MLLRLLFWIKNVNQGHPIIVRQIPKTGFKIGLIILYRAPPTAG
jgi:hypothetical protein